MSGISTKIKAACCPYTAAVIVAAGSGERFGGDKLAAEVAGVPVLIHTLRAFDESPMINEIVVVVRPDSLAEAAEFCARYDIKKLSCAVPGGQTRIESSFAGVMAVSERAEIVAIHDGARPLVTEKIIEDAVWSAYLHSAAAPAISVRDTIKRAEGEFVAETPERKTLFAVQTPQCFRRDIIDAALTDALKKSAEVTDDCSAVERIGGRVVLTEGSEENLKITTPLDLEMAEVILKRRGTP